MLLDFGMFVILFLIIGILFWVVFLIIGMFWLVGSFNGFFIVVGIFRLFYLFFVFLWFVVIVFKERLIKKNKLVNIVVVWVMKLFEFDELKIVFELFELNEVFIFVFLFCWININLISNSVIIRYVINSIL